MKKITKATLTALGLFPVYFFGGEVLAEERSQSIKNTQVYAELLQGKKTIGHADVLVPLLGTESSFLFTSVQAYMKSSDEQTFGGGLGYRTLNAGDNAVYGVNTFFDQQRSINNQNYSRVTVGVERLSNTWDVRSNYYNYMGTKKNRISKNFVSGHLQDLGNGANAIQMNHLYVDEQVHSGYDAEVGHNLGVKDLKAYVGGYSFGSDLTGWKIRAQYEFADRYSFNLLAQHDKERGSQVYGGFAVSLGKKVTGKNDRYQLLYQPVVRDMQLAVTETDDVIPELLSAKVFVVGPSTAKTSGTTLADALANSGAGDYIYVENDPDPYNIDGSINLKANQSLYGSAADLVIDGVTLKKGDGTAGPTFTNGNIVVDKAGHYEGFQLDGTGQSNDTHGFVIDGTTGVSLKNITIENFKGGGHSDGIRVGETSAATVTLENVKANGNDIGLWIDQGNVTITGANSQFNNNTYDGIRVQNVNASVTASDAQLNLNLDNGIRLKYGTAYLHNVTINNNGLDGIFAEQAGGVVHVYSGTDLTANTRVNVVASDGASIFIHENVRVANSTDDPGETVVQAQSDSSIEIIDPSFLVGTIATLDDGNGTASITVQDSNGGSTFISGNASSECSITDGIGACD